MSNVIRFALCLCFLFVGTCSRSDTLGAFIDSMPDQKITISWVMENSGKAMTYETASKIVSTAYAHGHSQQVDPVLLIAMMKQESGFRPTAKSNHGALGLMQVMPRWHRDKLRGRNPYSIETSIEVGTIVIRDCLTKHNNNKAKALSCYSGGSKNYATLVQRYQRQALSYVAQNRFNDDLKEPYVVATNDRQ